MSFTYSVIGSNTPENREHLEKLGYMKWMWVSTDNEEPFIDTIAHSSEYMAFGSDSIESSALRDDINCIGNPQLFKAVSAMRDDSDMHQLFFIEGLGGKDDYWLCDTEKFNHESENLPFDVYAYSKCDLYELQAHFQRV